MLGEREGTVLQARTFDIHGVRHVDVTVGFPDGGTLDARLGHESVPEGLAPGDEVIASTAMNMIVSIRRPEPRSDPR